MSLAMEGQRLRIGEQLIREGLINKEQLEEALQRQKETGAKIVATLVALGYLEQRAFLNFLARQPGMASINLAGYAIPREMLALVPAAFARKHEVVPMDTMGKVLTVGMAFPLDVSLISELEALTQMRIRALLVAPEAIQVALDKYYPTESEPVAIVRIAPLSPTVLVGGAILEQATTTLTLDGVMTLVRSVMSLPTMPDTVQRVQAAVEDPNMGAADVADILKRDPALAAKVISLANAPAHGMRHRVDSIEGATAMLGLREVYAVTIAATLVVSFTRADFFDYTAYWRRSAVCGSLAKILARTSGKSFGSGVYAAGLLHDIGRVVFAEVAPGPYGALNHALTDDELIQAEHDTFGIAHPEVGYVIAKSWALPAQLSESIRFHHQPERAEISPALVQLVALASRLTDHIELPEAMPLAACIDAAANFGADEGRLNGILDIARALRNFIIA